MADPATPPAASDEERVDSSADEKKKKGPKPKFGQILNLGSGKMWTVESSEGGSVTIMQRDGDRMVRRDLTEDEYSAAKENPLPSEFQRLKPPKGLSIGSYIDAGRIVGYDVATGEAQVEGAGGTSWISGKSLSGGGAGAALNRETSERGAGGPADIRSKKTQGGTVEPSGGVIHRAVSGFVAKNVKDLTGGLMDLSKQKAASSSDITPQASASPIVPSAPISPPTPSRSGDEGIYADSVETEVDESPIPEEVAVAKPAPVTPSVVVLPIVAVGGAVAAPASASAAPSVKIVPTVPVGTSSPAKKPDSEDPRLRAIEEELSLEHLKTKDSKWFHSRFTGELDKNGYLIGLNGKPTNFLPSQNIGADWERIQNKAREVFEKKYQITAPVPITPSRTISVSGTKAKPPAASSVSVSKIITVGGGAAVPEAAGTVTISAAVPAAAPVAAAPAAVSASVSVEIPQPSIRETRAQMRGDMKSAAVDYAKLVYSAPAPSAARGADQQQLYARAADALQVMSSRVASQRAAIQDLQGQANTLREEIAGLNAQPSPEATRKIQIASKKLGDTNNRIALSRFNMQADEARVQQLQIGTKLMRNAAPEIAAGRMPAVVVGMVERSIPDDIPPPSPARAAALIASMSGTSPVEPPPQHEEGAGGGGVRVAEVGVSPRSYAPAPPTGFVRSQPPRAGVTKRPTLPVSAAAFLSAQNADRSFTPGAGSPDARQAALGSAGAESGRPVIGTKPKSYAEDRDLSEAEQAQDIFNAGAGGMSSEFAKKQQQAQETQEQFLPEMTPGLEGPTFEKEADRPQSVRGEQLRAAALNAAQQRVRVAAMSTMLTEEEEAMGVASGLKGLKQAESVRRNVARMFDLFNAALATATSVTIIGALLEIIELLGSMNGRILTAIFFRNPRSVVRKFLPAAQFPFEFAAIIAVDFVVIAFIFLSLCITALPFLIIGALMALGVGGFAFAVAGS